MRDLLPDETAFRFALRGKIREAFRLHGYESVELPAIEYADVLELGLGSLDAHAVLRFVEPDTGEVVGLRPDMTAQVARMAATRLWDAPVPQRFCYQGTVLRRRHERARRHRQIPQAGIELIGQAGEAGDLEVLETACAAVSAAGLSQFVLDLGHASVGSSLVAELPEELRAEAVDALSRKAPDAICDVVGAAGVSDAVGAALMALPTLHGGKELWQRAEPLLANTPAAGPARDLRAFVETVTRRGLAERVMVDLGEVRSFDYYTGVMFQILAEGPGCAVGSGGRYDGLLGRYGASRPAAGFAIDLDHLSWALGLQGPAPAASPKALVVGARHGGLAVELMAGLRRLGVAAATAPVSSVQAHGAHWGFTHIIECAGQATAVLKHQGAATEYHATDPAELAGQIAREIFNDAPGSQGAPPELKE